jgi:broad specificity phosphatase PhoE
VLPTSPVDDFRMSGQRHIVLVRHARPSFDTLRPIQGPELAAAIAEYDACGIDPERIEGAQALAITRFMAGRVATLVSSDLPRSIESAWAFFPGLDLSDADPLYREAGLPAKVPIPLAWLKLSFSSFAAVMRVLWLFGLSSEAEAYAEARVRAVQAAHRLDQLAHRSGLVVLVGHGFQNRLIGRALKKGGWQTESRQGDGYGACTTFSSRINEA